MKRLTRKSVLAFFMALVLFVGNFGNVSLTAKAAEDGTGLVDARTITMNGTLLEDSMLVYKNDVLDVRYDLDVLTPGSNIQQGVTYEIDVPSNLLIASMMNWDAMIGSEVLCNCHYNNSANKIEVTFADHIFDGSYAGGIEKAYIGFYATVDGNGKNAGDPIVISGPVGTADDTTVLYGGDTKPEHATIAKTGSLVDEANKIVEWTVTVAEGPGGETSLVVKDTLSANQQLVAGSFMVDGAAAEPSVSEQNITYTLAIDKPMANKQHVIKYRTVVYPVKQDGTQYNVEAGDPLKVDAVNRASVHENADSPELQAASHNVTCDFGKMKWVEKKFLQIKTSPDNSADRLVTWQVKVHTANYTFTNVVLHDEITSAVLPGSELTYIWESFRMVNDADNSAVPGAALAGSPLFDAEGKCSWETTVIPTLAPGDYTITYDVKITNYINYKEKNEAKTKMGNSAWATYDKITASGTPGFGPGKTPVITVDAGDIATADASLSKYLPEVHYSYDVSERGAEVHGLPWMITVNADKDNLSSDYYLVEKIGGWSTDATKLPQYVASTTDKTKVIFDVEVDDVKATDEQYAQIQIAPWSGDTSELMITFGNLLTEGHKVTFRFQTYINESEKNYYEGHHMPGNLGDGVRIAYNDVCLKNGAYELWKDANIYAYTQVLEKKFESYNYNEHLATWRMEFNRDMMELKNAIVTDTLQTGTLDHVELVTHALDNYMESDGTRVTLTTDPTDKVYYIYDEATKEVAIHFGDVRRKQTYTIYVYEKIDPTDKVMDGDQEKSLSTFNGKITISNTATLTKEGSTPVVATASGDIDNKLFDKKAVIASLGKATYTIYMNQPRMNWPAGVKISDIMSEGLTPDLNSFKLYTADVEADGTMTKKDQIAADAFAVEMAVLGAGNKEKAPEGSVKTTITLPENTTNEAYIITYDVFVDENYTSKSGVNFDNTVTIDGGSYDGTPASETIALSQLMGYGSGSLNYSKVKISKVSEDGKALKGAEFDLLLDGAVIQSGTTDENGELVFSNLTPKMDYILKETKAPTGYLVADEVPFTALARGDEYYLVNPIEIKDEVDKKLVETKVSVTKKWVGEPAGFVEIILLGDDKEAGKQTLDAITGWNYTFEKLPVYDADDGHVIEYTVKEIEIPGYKSSVTGDAAEGFTVTNTITGKVSFDVEKVWVGPAAESVAIELYADGVYKETKELNAGNNWYYAFVNYEKYNDGKEIKYTIKEVKLDGYDSKLEGDMAAGFTVTNTNTEKIEIPVTKVWVGTPAGSAVVKLYADKAYVKSLTLTEETDWKGKFTDLQKYAAEDGHVIKYEIEEEKLEGYAASITGDAAKGFTVTNTIEGLVSVGVTKKWVGPAAEKVVINLLADGEKVAAKELTEADDWQYTFGGLDKYKAGKEIQYTIEEVKLDGYDSKLEGDMAAGFTVINTNTEKIEIPVTKVWVGTPAGSAVVKLYADNAYVKSLTLTEATDWKDTFKDLPKYDAVDGHEIVYSIEETAVEGYSTAMSGNVTEGFTVTNTIEGKVTIDVKKLWIGPAAEKVVINLLADNATVETVELNAGNNWYHAFVGREKYNAGKEIKYTIEEVSIEHYTTDIEQNANHFVITNTNTEKVSIPVTKVWVGPSVERVVVELLADGKVVGDLTLTAETAWKGTFAGFNKYAADGHEIKYKLSEVSVDGYRTDITGDAAAGFTVTNTITGTTSVKVEKKWIGAPADKVVVNLLADGAVLKTKELTEANNWQWTFNDLDKYKEGKEIQYTIEENSIENYSTVIAGDAAEGFTVTNTNDTKITIPVKKVWVGIPANKAVVSLLADGTVVETMTLSSANAWEDEFTDLRKYDAEDGHEISYKLTETAMDGYRTVITGDAANGFTVTNTIEGLVSVGVTKKWVGPAAEKAVIKLLADGKEAATAELNEENKWQYTFAGLDKYKDGVEIEYTIEEVSMIGYTSDINGDAVKGFVVTNTNCELISIPVTKVWVGYAIDKAVIHLLADGVVAGEVILNAENQWNGTFSDLRKYDAEDGHEIEYAISEVVVPGYSTAITGDAESGYVVTNTRRTTTTTTTKTPEETKKTEKRAPKTGDNSHLFLAVSLMAECLAGVFITLHLGRKKEK